MWKVVGSGSGRRARNDDEATRIWTRTDVGNIPTHGYTVSLPTASDLPWDAIILLARYNQVLEKDNYQRQDCSTVVQVIRNSVACTMTLLFGDTPHWFLSASSLHYDKTLTYREWLFSLNLVRSRHGCVAFLSLFKPCLGIHIPS